MHPAAACLLVLVVVVLAFWALRGAPAARGGVDAFFTPQAREEPTRSDVPYTGTLPLGPWGAGAWAEAAGSDAAPPPQCLGRSCERVYGAMFTDDDDFVRPVCATCRGARGFHDSIQSSRPHPFVFGGLAELMPYEAGPFLEGGVPVLN